MKTTLLLVALLFAGCGTVTPRQVVDPTPSFSGDQRNSGLLGLMPDGRAILDERAVARYNDLAASFGRRFSPPLQPGDGVTPRKWDGDRVTEYLMDQEHLVKFQDMAAWRRDGMTP